MSAKPRVLISNDDGIMAPGLTALAAAIRADGFCSFTVSAPAGERSAQSHCITIGKHLHAWELPVEGAEEAWAVDGTPADSTMLALYGPLLRNRSFNLVVSGINRGDNCGLHIIYSGTVGAAREAACKDVPALAVSLDNYAARSEEQYATAAAYTVAMMKAVLGVLPSPLKLSAGPSLAARLAGHVINLNVPKAEAVVDIQGYQLAWQGQHCHFPDWKELEADEHVKEGHAGAVTLRAFRNAAGSLRSDASEGCDSAAVQQGWVAVTPLGLRSDVPVTAEAAQQRLQPVLMQALAAAMQAAAASLGVAVSGLPSELLAANGAAATEAAAVAAKLQPEAVAAGTAV